MSSETAISTIETVKKKLERYTNAKQDDKVKEYLQKLHTTSVTSSLLRETKIDVLVNQLALNRTASYYETAKQLVKKWNDKSLLIKSSDASKVKTITNTNKTVTEQKLAMKRKSDHVDEKPSNSSSGSQSTNNNQDNSQSSSTKKRKVLSFSEYLTHKKPVSSTNNTNDNDKLTTTQIEEIYAQFDANLEKMPVNPADLAKDVNKKLTKSDNLHTNRNGLLANDHQIKLIAEPSKKSSSSFWDEEDDDDDEDEEKNQSINVKSSSAPPPKVSQPDKKELKKHHSDPLNQKSQTSTSSSATVKPKSNSQNSTIIAPPAPLPQPVLPPKKSADAFNFLRTKSGRQAVYSGKRVVRTSIPSLQDLCIETLKEDLEETSRKHFYLLPFEVVKPIIDLATPQQLDQIVQNNPNYMDDVEPLWEQHCLFQFKEAKREELETFYELYWRKHNEQEERLMQITTLAKQKRAGIVDNTRQTKKIALPQIKTSRGTILKTDLSSNGRSGSHGFSSSRIQVGRGKIQKPKMTPLFKKTLKLYQGKS